MNYIGIFLDRDGTINDEVDYLQHPSDFHLIPGSAEAIQEANSLGLKVIIITNQSGIARGLFTEADLAKINTFLKDELRKHGAIIDGIYYCPHHPDFGELPYKKNCSCRKPNIGMLLQARKDLGIDINKSFVIGDKMSDIQTGNNCGAKSILVLTGYGKKELDFCRQFNLKIDFVAENLYDAIQFVKRSVLETQSTAS